MTEKVSPKQFVFSIVNYLQRMGVSAEAFRVSQKQWMIVVQRKSVSQFNEGYVRFDKGKDVMEIYYNGPDIVADGVYWHGHAKGGVKVLEGNDLIAVLLKFS